MLAIVITDSSGTPKYLPIIPENGRCYTLGRAETCDFSLPYEPTLSEIHCTLTIVDGYVYLRDNASVNGIQVGGMPIAEEYMTYEREYTLGSCRLMLVYTEDTPAPRRAAKLKPKVTTATAPAPKLAPTPTPETAPAVEPVYPSVEEAPAAQPVRRRAKLKPKAVSAPEPAPVAEPVYAPAEEIPVAIPAPAPVAEPTYTPAEEAPLEQPVRRRAKLQPKALNEQAPQQDHAPAPLPEQVYTEPAPEVVTEAPAPTSQPALPAPEAAGNVQKSKGVPKAKSQARNAPLGVSASRTAKKYAPEPARTGALASLPTAFGLKLRLANIVKELTVGTALRFALMAEQQCHIFLLQYDSEGSPGLLVPGEDGIASTLFRNVETQFPSISSKDYDLMVEPPVGRETIIALACEEPSNFEAVWKEITSKATGPLEPGAAELEAIAACKSSAQPWASAILHITTVEK
ncbi:MAG: DUF4384 domain-containing protein [Akkermansia sp.]|nr:DUF4384 domain-containing protein [Akkermansia sp.]